jgi:hypothetical protein
MNIPKYKLIIQTNQYVGNFSRELTAFVFGYYWGAQDWINKLSGIGEIELGKYYDKILDCLHYFYDEHGDTICEIGSNQNDLVVYFDKKPNKNLLSVIIERINRSPEAISSINEFSVSDLKIKKIILIKI